MKFTISNTYPATTEDIFKAMLDKAYIEKKFTAMGGKNTVFLEFGEKNGQFIVKTQREVPSNPPGFAKKLIKPWNTIVQTDTWKMTDDASKKGLFEIVAQGTPITIGGTIWLKPTDDGCERVIETNIKCRIPLIGGKIEKFVEGDCRSNIDADHSFSLDYLKSLS